MMLAAAMLAKKALDAGLTIQPYIKTSISPGNGLAIEYLNKSGIVGCLDKLGFKIAGYGCSKCIENSTSLSDALIDVIEKNEIVAVGVLSGNRNFEGRIHPSTRASYLASPPLVIAYALAGRIDIDFSTEPIGFNSNENNKPVFLKDIWPTRAELQELETSYILPQIYFKVLEKINVTICF